MNREVAVLFTVVDKIGIWNIKPRAKVVTALALDDQAVKASPTERPKLLCRCCGAVMRIVQRRILPVMAPPVRLNPQSATSI